MAPLAWWALMDHYVNRSLGVKAPIGMASVSVVAVVSTEDGTIATLPSHPDGGGTYLSEPPFPL